MPQGKKNKEGIVYSTDRGRTCPGCSQAVDRCICKTSTTKNIGDGIVRISRQTKGRKGSGVTLVSGVLLDSAGLKQLAKNLKKKCGAGGAVKNGIIEIQGDKRQQLIAELEKEGYKVKLAGG